MVSSVRLAERERECMIDDDNDMILWTMIDLLVRNGLDLWEGSGIIWFINLTNLSLSSIDIRLGRSCGAITII